ncbi:MAG: hypothetical protein ABH885_04605 [Candidatus Omnitrophota bacterium]
MRIMAFEVFEMGITQKAFAVTDTMLCVSVLSLLVLAVTAGACIRDQQRLAAAAGTIEIIKEAVRRYSADGQATAAGFSIAALKKHNYLPADFRAYNSNPWGGGYETNFSENDSQRINITLTRVPLTACIRLSRMFADNADVTDYNPGKGTWTASFYIRAGGSGRACFSDAGILWRDGIAARSFPVFA